MGQIAPDLMGHFNPDLVGQYAPDYASDYITAQVESILALIATSYKRWLIFIFYYHTNTGSLIV